MKNTFCEIANHVPTAIESIGHYLCSLPQRLEDAFAAGTSRERNEDFLLEPIFRSLLWNFVKKNSLNVVECSCM